MKSSWKGEAAILAAGLMYALGAVLFKKLSLTLDIFFITFVYYAGTLLLCLVLLIVKKKKIQFFDWNYLLGWIIFSMATLLLYNLAISLSSSGRVTILYFTNPLFVALWGAILFGKRLRQFQWLSLILSLGGSALVLWDGLSSSLMGDILALGASLTIGLGLHFLNKAREKNGPLEILLLTSVIGLPLLAWSLPHGMGLQAPAWLLLVVLAVLAFGGYLASTWGYGHVGALEGSLLSVSEVLFVVILSILILGEGFNWRTVTGSVLILAGIGLNSWMEGKG